MTEKNTLYKLNSSRLSIVVVLIGVFLIMLFCNFNTDLVADDYMYCFSFADNSRIDSLADIFPSMAAHRHSMNGRVVAHFMVQLFLMLPKAVFNIFNAAFFTALVWLIYYIARRDGKNNALLLMCCFGLIWVLQPEFGQVYLWLDGSVNYLWCAVACLIWLIPWLRHFLGELRFSLPTQTLYIVFSVVVGAFSENASVALIFMAMLFIFLETVWQKRKIEKWMLISLLAAFVGFMYMMLAPAESVNKSAEFSIAVLFSNFIDTGLYYLRFWPLLVSFILFYYLAVKHAVEQQTRVLSAIFFLGSLAGHFVLMFAMYCAGRSTFIGLVLLICANTILFIKLFDGAYKKLLIALCALCLCFTAYWGYVGVRDIQRSHYLLGFNQEIILEALENGEKDIQVPRPYAQTKYSAMEGLAYLNTEDATDWPNVYMAKFYGADSIIGY